MGNETAENTFDIRLQLDDDGNIHVFHEFHIEDDADLDENPDIHKLVQRGYGLISLMVAENALIDKYGSIALFGMAVAASNMGGDDDDDDDGDSGAAPVIHDKQSDEDEDSTVVPFKKTRH